MLPPVDEATLKNNPGFAKLYAKLTSAVLNPDGSTRHDPAADKRAAVRSELDKRRLAAAKHHLLARAVATAVPPDASTTKTKPKPKPKFSQQPRPQQAPPPAAPPEEPLLDLLLLLPPLLSTDAAPLPQQDLELLFSHPPLADIDALLPSLAGLVAASLRSSALSLARITHPTTNPSYLHRHIATLPQTVAALAADLAAAEQALADDRLRALAALTALLRASSRALAHLVRALEAKHGVVARSLELRATEVALQARRQDLDAAQAAQAVEREVYVPEAVVALNNYAAHLRDARVRGEERIRGLKAELAEYGVGVSGGEGKEKMMKEMARVYKEMGRQMNDVKGDLDRLNDS